MSQFLDPHQRALHDYAKAIGSDPREHDDASLTFNLDGREARLRVKEGGSRIRGTVVIGQIPRTQDIESAQAWIETQPPPPTADLNLWRSRDGAAVMRMVWERTLPIAGAESDPIVAEVSAYLSAWQERRETAYKASAYDLRDPRDSAPQQAWLVIGDNASWPDAVELAEQAAAGDAGVFESLWTVAKQTQPGDLLLFYFMGERKAVRFVARAASAAFYDDSIDVGADAPVANQQWWAYHTPLIAIQPIPFSDLKDAADGHLILRGRSGKLLHPSVISRLRLSTKDPADRDALDEVIQIPTGRTDLPDPASMTWEDVKELAGGALTLEAHVEEYIVKPLLRDCLESSGLRYQQQYPVGKQRADFVVLEGDNPRCVIEVKLAINDSGDWSRSPDLKQTLGYAKALDCAAVLIDTQRIVLIDQGSDSPSRIIDRADLATGFMWSGTLYDLAEHLGFPFWHRANQAGSYRDLPPHLRTLRRRNAEPRASRESDDATDAAGAVKAPRARDALRATPPARRALRSERSADPSDPDVQS